METNKKQQIQSGDGKRVQGRAPGKNLGKNPGTQDVAEVHEVAPGIPVVRSSTPKPLSFGSGETPLAPVFPSKAPSAPPLPEELDDEKGAPTTSGVMPAIPLTTRPRPALEESQEFVWLFEYSLEMEPTLLNSQERLNGLALLYGPALLKGYTLLFGRSGAPEESASRFIATIAPSADAGAEVWGVLYRIPRRLMERTGNDPSLVDAIHAATTPLRIFEAKQVLVRERYRDREISCTTYIASEQVRQRLQSSSHEVGSADQLFIQRISIIARQQRLPDAYITAMMPVSGAGIHEQPLHRERSEKDTDPLPVWHEQRRTAPLPNVASSVPTPWMMAFAVYLMFVLLLILGFAVLQALGFGSRILTRTFAPLGVPWLVLVYGLLGSCISCIISLGRSKAFHLPAFIILTWFTRPYIGIVLAMLAYLFLNSGLFNLVGNAEQRMAGFLLFGALAGLCEGWLFFRRT